MMWTAYERIIRSEETILGLSSGWYKGVSTQRGRADGKAFQEDKAGNA